MNKGTQIKALLQSYIEGDDDRFFAVAMQMAAHEARCGHAKLATEIRAIIDDAKSRRGMNSLVSLADKRGESTDIFEVSWPKARLNHMVLSPVLAEKIQRVVREQRRAGRILERGLRPRRKLLLLGPSGTGKTLTASVLAGELGMPLTNVRLDGLITRFRRDSEAKLRQIFDAARKTRGVYLFDNLGAVGTQCSSVNDDSESFHALDSFLQLIENDRSHSLIIAATNKVGLFDAARFRHFDEVVHHVLPDQEQSARLLKARLYSGNTERVRWMHVAKDAVGLSHAEIDHTANDALKVALIGNKAEIEEADIRAALAERKAMACSCLGHAESE